MVPKTEDKTEEIGFTWGQKALLTTSFAQRKSAPGVPTTLCDFTSIECEWLEANRSVLVAYGIKSPMRGNQGKHEIGTGGLDQTSIFFTL